MDMVRLENVVKMYDNGKRAVNGINLAIEAGAHVVIVGASGSGKTTLLKLIAGVEPPSAGSIVVDGKVINEMDSDTAADFRNRTFGILSRRPGFTNTLTMMANIALPLAVRKIPVKERNQLVIEHMNTLGIGHLAAAFPPQLSIMELQLSSLVRTLTVQPKILLLDNMDTDLTAKEREKMRGLIHAAWKFGELTMIRFTDRENDDRYDRRFHLEYGRITED